MKVDFLAYRDGELHEVEIVCSAAAARGIADGEERWWRWLIARVELALRATPPRA